MGKETPDSGSTHALKCWPESFEAIRARIKTHEYRIADRDFSVGDMLRLREYDPTISHYTGRENHVRVTYITRAGDFGLQAGTCIMSVTLVVTCDRPPSGSYHKVTG